MSCAVKRSLDSDVPSPLQGKRCRLAPGAPASDLAHHLSPGHFAPSPEARRFFGSPAAPAALSPFPLFGAPAGFGAESLFAQKENVFGVGAVGAVGAGAVSPSEDRPLSAKRRRNIASPLLPVASSVSASSPIASPLFTRFHARPSAAIPRLQLPGSDEASCSADVAGGAAAEAAAGVVGGGISGVGLGAATASRCGNCGAVAARPAGDECISLEQAKALLTQALDEVEVKLSLEYDDILKEKLQDQFYVFSKYRQDHIHRPLGEETCSYMS